MSSGSGAAASPPVERGTKRRRRRAWLALAVVAGLSIGGLSAAATGSADPPNDHCYWATADCAYDLIAGLDTRNSGVYNAYGNRMRSASTATNKAVWYGNFLGGTYQNVQDLNWNYPSGYVNSNHWCKNNQTGGTISYCGMKLGY